MPSVTVTQPRNGGAGLKKILPLWLLLIFGLFAGVNTWTAVKYPFDPAVAAGYQVALILILVCGVQFTTTSWQSRFLKGVGLLLGGVALALVFQVGCLVVNIYRFDVPGWFFTLKLHRLITLPFWYLLRWLLLAVGLWWSLKFDLRPYIKIKLWSAVALLMLAVGVWQLQLGMSQLLSTSVRALQNLPTPYFERITSQLGGVHYYGWIWPYSQFIKRITPENAVIVLPPQSDDWKMEGNVEYLRWYLYPRRLVHMMADNQIPPNAEYILIAKGECINVECGWPKITIPARQVEFLSFIDRDSQAETLIRNEGYDPIKYQDFWGILKLKR